MFRRDLSTRLAYSWIPKPTNLEKHFIKMKRVREDKVTLLSFSLLACSYFRKKEGGKEEKKRKENKKRGDMVK